VQPAVLRLRTQAGATAVAVFLSPGGHADLTRLPAGDLQPEFAIGELWSRACNSFAAGMRAWRLRTPARVPGGTPLIVVDENGNPDALPLTDDAFERP